MSHDYDSGFLEMVLDNLATGVCATDPTGKIIYVNNTLCFFTGYSRAQLVGDNIFNMISRGQADTSMIEDVLAQKRSVSKFLKFRRRSGTFINLFITQSPVFDENGEIAYGIALERDIKSEEDLYMRSMIRARKRDDGPEFSTEETELIYESPAMKRLVESLNTVCTTQIPILIEGETGVGKEVIAKYIHANSNHGKKQMVYINCAEIPESLIEQELLGYEKNSFPGAAEEGKPGVFERANGSTIFLDEINALSTAGQTKILRILETSTVQRIGGQKRKNIDFRLIASTSENLLTCVNEGTFRLDLYYRICSYSLTIPPLRERREDIIPLVDHFLEDSCRRYICTKHFSKNVYDNMLKYDWPGNVRQLKMTVESAVLTSAPSVKYIKAIPDEIAKHNFIPHRYPSGDKDALPTWEQEQLNNSELGFWDSGRSLEENMDFYEKRILLEARRVYKSTSRIAEALGVNQSTISRKLAKYGIY